MTKTNTWGIEPGFCGACSTPERYATKTSHNSCQKSVPLLLIQIIAKVCFILLDTPKMTEGFLWIIFITKKMSKYVKIMK